MIHFCDSKLYLLDKKEKIKNIFYVNQVFKKIFKVNVFIYVRLFVYYNFLNFTKMYINRINRN